MATPSPPRLPSGERLRRAGIAAWSIIGLLIVTSVFLYLLFKIRVIFPPLVLALIIIYVLNPLVTRLERRGIARMLGALLAFIVFFGTITLIVLALIRPISNQVASFGEQVPEFRHRTVGFVQDAAATLKDRFGLEFNTDDLVCLIGEQEDTEGAGEDPTASECDQVTQDLRDRIAAQAGRITEIGGTILEILLVFVLAPLLALYLLIDLPHIQRDILNLVPETHRDEVADLGSKIGTTVGGFFRGQLFVAFIVGVMASVGFAAIGLPFWLVIGAIAGITNLIPLVGPFIGGGIGMVIGVISEGAPLGLKAAGVALVVQQIDNHIISPNVMKRTVQLHPVTVMLALLAGGTLAGFWGVLLGVPAVAVAKLILGHLWLTRVLGAEASPHVRTRGADPPSVVPDPAGAPPLELDEDGNLPHKEE